MNGGPELLGERTQGLEVDGMTSESSRHDNEHGGKGNEAAK